MIGNLSSKVRTIENWVKVAIVVEVKIKWRLNSNEIRMENLMVNRESPLNKINKKTKNRMRWII